jgi:pimeloyl-ACP methyl ester carboxylesterase
VLHYHAALRRPDLYRGLVMLDSPVLSRADQLVIQAAKRFGLIDRLTPARRTLGRREAFADGPEARRYFAERALFSRFDPECLDAYVEHGLHPHEDGLRLRFEVATEISIYRSVPHTSPGRPQELQVPLALVKGAESRVVLAHHGRMARRAPRGEFLVMPGGHMFPLEHPDATAQLIRRLFTRWQQPRESMQ